MFSAFLLVIAVCLDAFATSVTYGLGKIKIPLYSAFIISLIGTGFLGLSFFTASFISKFLSSNACNIIGAVLLGSIGLYIIFQPFIKRIVERFRHKCSFIHTNTFVNIYLDQTAADLDGSKTLNLGEAFFLAIALSIDSLATGVSFGLGINNTALILVATFVTCFLSIIIGCRIGIIFGNKSNIDLSFLSGLLLIILAVLKLF